MRNSHLIDQPESVPHTDVEPNHQPEARRVIISGPRSIRFLNMSALKNTVGGGLFSSRGGDGTRPSVSAVEIDNEAEVDVIENTTGGICSSILRYCRGLLDVRYDDSIIVLMFTILRSFSFGCLQVPMYTLCTTSQVTSRGYVRQQAYRTTNTSSELCPVIILF